MDTSSRPVAAPISERTRSTGIEWTDATWNPVTGCSKLSPGCAHCYAETLSLRYGWSKKPWTPENAAENVVLHPERLDKPMHWRKPRMIFVNSMSDLFHENVPDEFIGRVFNIMGSAHWHTFQVLTKRPERMAAVVTAFYETLYKDDRWTPFPNVWLGTSIENMRWVGRADALRETPAAVRFISAEPLLGPLVEWFVCPDCENGCEDCYGVHSWPSQESLSLSEIDWLIVGGESGPNHRPMEAEWARDLRDLAAMYDTAFFFKQWGGRTPKAGGRELDGVIHDEWPEVRRVAA